MRWRLWYDNVRDAPSPAWEVARTTEQASLLIMQLGFPSEISFDHDMGWTWGNEEPPLVDLSEMVLKGQIPGDPEDVRQVTGMDFCQWLKDMKVDDALPEIPADFKYYVHSSNKRGAELMVTMLTEVFGKGPSGMYKWYELEQEPDIAEAGALVGVQLKYANGLVQTLRGKDAAIWLDFVNGPMVLQQARQGAFPAPGYKWKYTQDQ